VTCGKTQGFLASRNVVYKETVDAGKAKLGRDEALRLAHEASKIVAAKGKKIVVFDMKRDPPDEPTLLGVLLGPTGNLRAPTLKKGTTLIIGFDEEAYAKLFG
jgi:hypothetical protein